MRTVTVKVRLDDLDVAGIGELVYAGFEYGKPMRRLRDAELKKHLLRYIEEGVMNRRAHCGNAADRILESWKEKGIKP